MRGVLAALLLLLLSCSGGEVKELQGRYVEVDEKGNVVLRCQSVDGEAVTPFSLRFSSQDVEWENIQVLIKGSPITVSYYGKVRNNRLEKVESVWVDPRYEQLTGRWIEVGDGAAKEGMGFELMPDNQASTIGMQTVIFNRWDYASPSTLRLSGHCYDTGHGNTVNFDDEWNIDLFDGSRLEISVDNLALKFVREQESEPQTEQPELSEEQNN